MISVDVKHHVYFFLKEMYQQSTFFGRKRVKQLSLYRFVVPSAAYSNYSLEQVSGVFLGLTGLPPVF